MTVDIEKLTRWTFDGGMTAEVSKDGQWVAYKDLKVLVEHLRAESATRCRAEGGDTSTDGSVINYGSPVDKCAAPAAGTVEKDAALIEVATEAAVVFESAAKHNADQGRTVFAHAQQDRADRMRAAIEAHTRIEE